MEILDQGNDQISQAYEYCLGKGKDVLIGWLVGRAGADLGLAQALAASYAERGQPGRETEGELASLNGATREQPHMVTSAESSIKEVEERLESKIEEMHDQLTKQGEMLQSWYAELREVFRTELSVLQGELREVQDRLDAQHSTNDKSIGDLQAKLKENYERFENGHEELDQINSQVNAIAQRLAQAETTIQQAQALASSGSHEMQQAVESLKSEIAALKIQLSQSPATDERPDFLLRELEERLEAKIQDTQHELTKARDDSEVRDSQLEESLRAELALVQSVRSDQAAAESLIHAAEERFAGSIHDLEIRLAGALEMLDSHGAEITTLKAQARSVAFAPCSESSLDAEGQSKDQFQELLQRISTEMERVRTELKENNGRWKIRRAFHV